MSKKLLKQASEPFTIRVTQQVYSQLVAEVESTNSHKGFVVSKALEKYFAKENPSIAA